MISKKEIIDDSITDIESEYKVNIFRVLILCLCFYYLAEGLSKYLYQNIQLLIIYIQLNNPSIFTLGKGAQITFAIKYLILLIIAGGIFIYREKVASNAPIGKPKFVFYSLAIIGIAFFIYYYALRITTKIIYGLFISSPPTVNLLNEIIVFNLLPILTLSMGAYLFMSAPLLSKRYKIIILLIFPIFFELIRGFAIPISNHISDVNKKREAERKAAFEIAKKEYFEKVGISNITDCKSRQEYITHDRTEFRKGFYDQVKEGNYPNVLGYGFSCTLKINEPGRYRFEIKIINEENYTYPVTFNSTSTPFYINGKLTKEDLIPAYILKHGTYELTFLLTELVINNKTKSLNLDSWDVIFDTSVNNQAVSEKVGKLAKPANFTFSNYNDYLPMTNPDKLNVATLSGSLNRNFQHSITHITYIPDYKKYWVYIAPEKQNGRYYEVFENALVSLNNSPSSLTNLKVGDKVTITLDKEGNVTQITANR